MMWQERSPLALTRSHERPAGSPKWRGCRQLGWEPWLKCNERWKCSLFNPVLFSSRSYILSRCSCLLLFLRSKVPDCRVVLWRWKINGNHSPGSTCVRLAGFKGHQPVPHVWDSRRSVQPAHRPPLNPHRPWSSICGKLLSIEQGCISRRNTSTTSQHPRHSRITRDTSSHPLLNLSRKHVQKSTLERDEELRAPLQGESRPGSQGLQSAAFVTLRASSRVAG